MLTYPLLVTAHDNALKEALMNQPNNVEFDGNPIELHSRQEHWDSIANLIFTAFTVAMWDDKSSDWWHTPTKLVGNAFRFASQYTPNSAQDTAPWLWHRTFILEMLDGNLNTSKAPYPLVEEAGTNNTRVVRFPDFEASFPYDFFMKAWWQDADTLLEMNKVSAKDITRITDRHCPICHQFVETEDFVNNNWAIMGRVDGDSKWGRVVQHRACSLAANNQ